jgi:hypothetical protein
MKIEEFVENIKSLMKKNGDIYPFLNDFMNSNENIAIDNGDDLLDDILDKPDFITNLENGQIVISKSNTNNTLNKSDPNLIENPNLIECDSIISIFVNDIHSNLLNVFIINSKLFYYKKRDLYNTTETTTTFSINNNEDIENIFKFINKMESIGVSSSIDYFNELRKMLNSSTGSVHLFKYNIDKENAEEIIESELNLKLIDFVNTKNKNRLNKDSTHINLNDFLNSTIVDSSPHNNKKI